MKRCNVCGIDKNLSEFHKNSKMKGGLLNKCKACVKDYSKSYRYGEKWGEILEKDRARYRADEKRRERLKVMSKEWAKNNPGRLSAQKAVSNAIRDKKIEKLPCWVCGEEKVEAHHPDYDRPLDVVWLCPSHHKQTHTLIRKTQ